MKGENSLGKEQCQGMLEERDVKVNDGQEHGYAVGNVDRQDSDA